MCTKLYNDWCVVAKGCELHSITYISDDECTPENIEWMNELAKDLDANFTQCIVFKAITVLCIIVCVITVFVIVFILYYLVKMRIMKERFNLGIAKAMGYTTKELIIHNNISFVPLIFISSIVGTVFASLFINPLCSLMLSMVSIKRCELVIQPEFIAGIVGNMTIVAIITVTLISLRIRKLKPRELVVE